MIKNYLVDVWFGLRKKEYIGIYTNIQGGGRMLGSVQLKINNKKYVSS